MDNTKNEVDTVLFARTDLGRGESPAQVTMPMDHLKQLSPRLSISGRTRGTTRATSLLTMPGQILPRSESQGLHNSFTQDASVPASLQGHEEKVAVISTFAGLIQVLARIDARTQEPARA